MLQPGGILRLVLPDCEEMFSTYLELRRNNKHNEADVLVIEIIDQSVRAYPGGELLKFYQSINLMSNSDQRYWREFIFWRNGETLENYMAESGQNCTKSAIKHPRSKLQIINRGPRKIKNFTPTAAYKKTPCGAKGSNNLHNKTTKLNQAAS